MSYFDGKKLVWIGDSISYGSELKDRSAAFPYGTAAHLGMSVKNYGIGGSVLARRRGDYARCYTDLEAWREDVAAGRVDPDQKYLVRDGLWEPRPYRLYRFEDGAWVRGGTDSVDAARTPLVDRLGEMDPNADAIVVMIGTNDFYWAWTPFGSPEDGYFSKAPDTEDLDVTTFCGAYHAMARTLLERWRGRDIFLLTPIKLYQVDAGRPGSWPCRWPEDKNALGLTLGDYCRAMKRIAAYYSIPIIDLQRCSGLSPQMNPELFADPEEGTRVHPSSEGHRRLALTVSSAMRSLHG